MSPCFLRDTVSVMLCSLIVASAACVSRCFCVFCFVLLSLLSSLSLFVCWVLSAVVGVVSLSTSSVSVVCLSWWSVFWCSVSVGFVVSLLPQPCLSTVTATLMRRTSSLQQMCVCMYVCVGVCVWGAHGLMDKALDPLSRKVEVRTPHVTKRANTSVAPAERIRSTISED